MSLLRAIIRMTGILEAALARTVSDLRAFAVQFEVRLETLELALVLGTVVVVLDDCALRSQFDDLDEKPALLLHE